MEFKFIQRKCDVEEEKRVHKFANVVNTAYAKSIIEEHLKDIEVRHKLEEYVTDRINNDKDNVEVKQNSEGKTYYKFKVSYIDIIDNVYEVCEDMMSVQLVRENYKESWRNVGADYHWMTLSQSNRGIDYWNSKNHAFLVEQLYNADKLKDMCEELNILRTNYID